MLEAQIIYMPQAQKFTCWALENVNAGSSKVYMLEAQKVTWLKLKNLDA